MQLNIYYIFSVGKQRQITHAGTEMNEKDDYRLLHQRLFQTFQINQKEYLWQIKFNKFKRDDCD